MATLLWIDTEWDEAINLGDPFRLWEIFAELLRSGVDEDEMPDLFQVVEVAESQEDCDLDWLERVQNQAAKFLRLHGHDLSPAAKEILELLRKGEGETMKKSLFHYRTKSVPERPEDVKTKPRTPEPLPQTPEPTPAQAEPSPEAKTKKRDIGEAPKPPEIKPKAEFGIKPEPPQVKPSLKEEKKEKLESGNTPTKVIKAKSPEEIPPPIPLEDDARGGEPDHIPAEPRKEESQPGKFRDPRGKEIRSKDVDGFPIIPDYAKCPVIEDRPEENDRRGKLTQMYLSQPATRKVALGGIHDKGGNKGRNDAFRMIFGDVYKGEPISMAVFKPSYGESPEPLRYGVNPGTYYRREVAAGMTAQLLGLGDLVPHASFRSADYGKYMTDLGSAAEWVSNSTVAGRVLEIVRFGNTENVVRGALFDYITGNTDRHAGNWMMQTSEKVGDPMKMVLIDHGLTFPFMFGGNEFDQMSHDSALIHRAIRQNLPTTDVSTWRAKTKQLGAILTWCGIESKAIEMTLKRLHAITSPRYNSIAKLPNPMEHIRTTGPLGPIEYKKTLGDLYKSSF